MNNTGLLIGLAYRKKDIETEKESCVYQDGLYTRFVEGRIFEFNRTLHVLQTSNVLSETEAEDLKIETFRWELEEQQETFEEEKAQKND